MFRLPEASKPTLTQRAALGLISRLLGAADRGRLDMRLPTGEILRFGPGGGRQAEIEARSWKFFTRLVRGGDVGLGEAYQHGDFDSPDLTELIRFFIDNEPALERRYARASALGKLADRLAHLARGNSRKGSRRNIQAHYDLSNEMFAAFLDESMTYSCAVFASEQETLAQAQARKRAMILDKARLEPGMKVLEIGSGWGALAVDAAKRGAHVTSITLSKEQLKEAQARAEREGVSERISFELRDYRDTEGRFDRVISVEMIEAVGHEFLPRFFGKIDALLAPGGLAVLQAITLPDHRYEGYRRRCDWIQKHIFPGAVVPSTAALARAMAEGSRLTLVHLESIGVHYARTLREWRKAFLAEAGPAAELRMPEDFKRTWDYYFSYCEAGFASHILGDIQIVLARSGDEGRVLHQACPQ